MKVFPHTKKHPHQNSLFGFFLFIIFQLHRLVRACDTVQLRQR